MKLLSISLAALSLSAAALADQGGSELSSILQAMAERMSSIKTVRVSGEWTVEVGGGEGYETNLPVSIVFQRPDRMRFQSGDTMFVANGSNVWLRPPMKKPYLCKARKGTVVDALADDDVSPFLFLMPDKRALVSADPLKELNAFSSKAEITVLEAGRLDGHPCWIGTTRLKIGSIPGKEAEFTVFVDKECGLVRRAEQVVGRPPAVAEDQADNDRLQNMKYTYVLSEIVVNGEVSDEDFRFDPGEDESRVEGFIVPTARGDADQSTIPGEPSPDFEEKRFKKIWEHKMENVAGDSGGRATIRIPPEYIVVRSGDQLNVFEARSGTPRPSIASSAEVKEKVEEARFFYTEAANGPLVVAVQAFDHSKDAFVTYIGETGEEVWSLLVDESMHVREAGIVPTGRDQDALFMIVCPNEFWLFDLEGKEVLRQKIGRQDDFMVTDLDGDGSAEFYVIGGAVTCYDLAPENPAEQ
ncbi:MAG: hypothetical protein KJ626_00860 [Verrucomicrobia bacterium]|nr:hypothetical protein [Verrucomicrobiota bacterium]